ncbi:MAG: hypothetical protein ACLR5Y_05640 [Haemophilus parainfluenzae]
MDGYTLLGLKLAMGIIGLVLQINLMGKGNLAPTSAMDQVQNYVLGGIIGGVIYSDSIGVFQSLSCSCFGHYWFLPSVLSKIITN